jgi:hypothetical protein
VLRLFSEPITTLDLSPVTAAERTLRRGLLHAVCEGTEPLLFGDAAAGGCDLNYEGNSLYF